MLTVSSHGSSWICDAAYDACSTPPLRTRPVSITVRTPELGAVGWFSPDDLPETDREAADVISLIKQVRAGGSRMLVR